MGTFDIGQLMYLTYIIIFTIPNLTFDRVVSMGTFNISFVMTLFNSEPTFNSMRIIPKLIHYLDELILILSLSKYQPSYTQSGMPLYLIPSSPFVVICCVSADKLDL